MTKDHIIISIAPGITVDSVRETLGADKRIVRAMPNTPALLGEGMTGVCYDPALFAKEEHVSFENEFKLCNVYAKDKCRDCFARFYCSGGCAANSFNFHGSITDAYDIGCEMQKKRIECAIMIKAALAEEE